MKLTRIILVFLTALSILAAQSTTKKGSAPVGGVKNEAAAKPGSMEKAKVALIDVNSASEADLKTLDGIGDAYAAKIVKNRPYRGKNEIVSKAGVPQKTYDKIKDKIIAKQSLSQKKK